MTTIRHTVTIARPAADVWNYLMDIRNDPVWTTNVVGVGRGAGEPVEIGLDFEETYKFLGVEVPLTFTITEHEPCRRSAVEIVGGPVPGRGSYDLEDVGDATRLTVTMEAEAHGFFRLTEPVFRRMARREIATSALHLKDILETDGSS